MKGPGRYRAPQWGRALRGRQRFAGEDGFVAFETAGFQQPQIGRHHIAQRQSHRVAWEQ